MHFLADVNRAVPRLQKGSRKTTKEGKQAGYLVKNMRDAYRLMIVEDGKHMPFFVILSRLSDKFGMGCLQL